MQQTRSIMPRKYRVIKVQIAQVHNKQEMKDKQQQKQHISTFQSLLGALGWLHEQLRRVLSHVLALVTFRFQAFGNQVAVAATAVGIETVAGIMIIVVGIGTRVGIPSRRGW